MLDFTPVHERKVTMHEFTQHLTQADLRALTEESIASLLDALEGCADEEIVFVPDDPDANDPYASDPGDGMKWVGICAWALAKDQEHRGGIEKTRRQYAERRAVHA